MGSQQPARMEKAAISPWQPEPTCLRQVKRAMNGKLAVRELSFEGCGLQPVRLLRDVGRALALEGTSCGRLSSPQRLKPVPFDCSMYGLKAVPFKMSVLRQTAQPWLRSRSVFVH
jgi:hypothetical protein